MKKCLSAVLFTFAAYAGYVNVYEAYKNPSNREVNRKNSVHAARRIKEEFCFAVVGDTRDNPAIFKTILEGIRNDPEIEFAVHLGDLVVQPSRHRFDTELGFVREKLSIPWLQTCGNHDVSSGRELYEKVFGYFYYSFAAAGNLFIVLDTSNSVNLDYWQRQWLANVLRDQAAAKNKFVFMHVPPNDPRPGEYRGLQDRVYAEELMAQLRAAGIDMVFAGHIRGHYTGDWNGLPFTLTNGAGEIYGDAEDPAHFFHYVKVRVTGGEFKVEVVRFDPPVIAGLSRIMSKLGGYANEFLTSFGLLLGTLILCLAAFRRNGVTRHNGA